MRPKPGLEPRHDRTSTSTAPCARFADRTQIVVFAHESTLVEPGTVDIGH